MKIDSEAISKLIEHRVFCNKELENHSTVQVLVEHFEDEKTEVTVGFLGILNGFCGVLSDKYDSFGPITAIVDDNGIVTEFTKTGQR